MNIGVIIQTSYHRNQYVSVKMWLLHGLCYAIIVCQYFSSVLEAATIEMDPTGMCCGILYCPNFVFVREVPSIVVWCLY